MITSTIRRCEKEVFNYFDAPETNAFVEGLNRLSAELLHRGEAMTSMFFEVKFYSQQEEDVKCHR